MNIVSILIGFALLYLVYLCYLKMGFSIGFIVNLVIGGVTMYLKNTKPNLGIKEIALTFLIVMIETVVQYIAYQKANSFLGYVGYLLLFIVGTVLVVVLFWAVFSFIANPSILLK